MDTKPDDRASKDQALGVLYGALSFGMWGLLPIYWKVIDFVPAYEILAHRILWSFVFVGIILTYARGWHKLTAVFKDKKSLMYLVMSSLLIGINWFAYIWAVNTGHIVESSMGYYINPLMSVLLGMLVLREKMNPWQWAALVLASTGVAFMTVQYGSIPWISLILAVSFALYGLCKKMVKVESLVGLALETAILVPFALGLVVFKQVQGTGALGTVSMLVTVLLICSGIVTATPLLLFAKGAKRVRLATIGFLQYLSPSLSLVLAILVYKEHFSKVHLVSFSFIWAALVLYSLSQFNFIRNIPLNITKINKANG